MTCIVGLVAADGVYVGGDALYSGDCQRFDGRDGGKVFRLGPAAVGVSGAARLNQILTVHSKFAWPSPDENLTCWMVDRFATEVQRLLEAHKGIDPAHGWTITVGLHHRLFVVDYDFCVMEYDRYHAEGCARGIALGYLEAWLNPVSPMPGAMPSSEALVVGALEAAAKHDLHVGTPFTVLRAE